MGNHPKDLDQNTPVQHHAPTRNFSLEGRSSSELATPQATREENVNHKPESSFRASPAKVRYVDHLMAAEEGEAPTVSARALKRWRTDERFRRWLPEEINRRLIENVSPIWIVVAQLALKGNLHAAKLYLGRFDKDAPGPIEPNTFAALARLVTLATTTQEDENFTEPQTDPPTS